MTKTLPFYLLAGAILVLAIALFFNQTNTALGGGGWMGFSSHLQSATTTAVGPTEIITVFDDQVSGTCRSRVITTTDSAIMISFDDTAGFGSTTVAGLAGHWQAASTTTAYDSGLYGCGLLSVYGYASTTLTISSF